MDYDFKTEIKPDIYGFEYRFDKNVIEFEKDYRKIGFITRYLNIKTNEELSRNEYYKKLRQSTNIDFDITAEKCFVEWGTSIEARSWGIKSISSYVKKVICNISWEVYVDDLSEQEKQMLYDLGGVEYGGSITGTIEIDSDNGQFDWVINESIKPSNSGDISPTTVEIDFENLKINVE